VSVGVAARPPRGPPPPPPPPSWSSVAKRIPGRTGQQCAQRWRHRVNPVISKDRWTPEEDAALASLVATHGSAWAEISRALTGRTDQQCMGRWRRHLDPTIRREGWSPAEDATLTALVASLGSRWAAVSRAFDGRTAQQCRARWFQLGGGAPRGPRPPRPKKGGGGGGSDRAAVVATPGAASKQPPPPSAPPSAARLAAPTPAPRTVGRPSKSRSGRRRPATADGDRGDDDDASAPPRGTPAGARRAGSVAPPASAALARAAARPAPSPLSLALASPDAGTISRSVDVLDGVTPGSAGLGGGVTPPSVGGGDPDASTHLPSTRDGSPALLDLGDGPGAATIARQRGAGRLMESLVGGGGGGQSTPPGDGLLPSKDAAAPLPGSSGRRVDGAGPPLPAWAASAADGGGDDPSPAWRPDALLALLASPTGGRGAGRGDAMAALEPLSPAAARVGLALADLPSPAAAALAGLIASPLETGERPPAFDLGAAAGVESPAKKARVGCAAGGGGGRARRARLVG